MTASVVSSKPATDAAFWSAERTTLVGSITPACTRFSLRNRLIDGVAQPAGRIRRRPRLGGLLNFYERAA
jgi:hypothetical protein